MQKYTLPLEISWKSLSKWKEHLYNIFRLRMYDFWPDPVLAEAMKLSLNEAIIAKWKSEAKNAPIDYFDEPATMIHRITVMSQKYRGVEKTKMEKNAKTWVLDMTNLLHSFETWRELRFKAYDLECQISSNEWDKALELQLPKNISNILRQNGVMIPNILNSWRALWQNHNQEYRIRELRATPLAKGIHMKASKAMATLIQDYEDDIADELDNTHLDTEEGYDENHDQLYVDEETGEYQFDYEDEEGYSYENDPEAIFDTESDDDSDVDYMSYWVNPRRFPPRRDNFSRGRRGRFSSRGRGRTFPTRQPSGSGYPSYGRSGTTPNTRPFRGTGFRRPMGGREGLRQPARSGFQPRRELSYGRISSRTPFRKSPEGQQKPFTPNKFGQSSSTNRTGPSGTEYRQKGNVRKVSPHPFNRSAQKGPVRFKAKALVAEDEQDLLLEQETPEEQQYDSQEEPIQEKKDDMIEQTEAEPQAMVVAKRPFQGQKSTPKPGGKPPFNRHQDLICSLCNKKGHIGRNCPDHYKDKKPG